MARRSASRSSASAARRSTRARSRGAAARPARLGRRARPSRASIASGSPASATRQSASPVEGSSTASVRPERASRRSPADHAAPRAGRHGLPLGQGRGDLRPLDLERRHVTAPGDPLDRDRHAAHAADAEGLVLEPEDAADGVGQVALAGGEVAEHQAALGGQDGQVAVQVQGSGVHRCPPPRARDGVRRVRPASSTASALMRSKNRVRAGWKAEKSAGKPGVEGARVIGHAARLGPAGGPFMTRSCHLFATGPARRPMATAAARLPDLELGEDVGHVADHGVLAEHQAPRRSAGWSGPRPPGPAPRARGRSGRRARRRPRRLGGPLAQRAQPLLDAPAPGLGAHLAEAVVGDCAAAPRRARRRPGAPAAMPAAATRCQAASRRRPSDSRPDAASSNAAAALAGSRGMSSSAWQQRM